MIAFASSFPGSINALEISAGRSMIVQKSAFLAAAGGSRVVYAFPEKAWKRLVWR